MLQNVDAKVAGSVLTLTVDLSKDLGLSKSGKSNLIGTTGGSVKIGNVVVGLNVFKPVKAA